MSRSFRWGNHRFLLAGVASLLLGLSFATASASAGTIEANCAGLQEALNHASAGDTITLTQMCTTSNSGVQEGKFELPKEAAFTLTGAPGAGFDGTGISGPVLSGLVEGLTLSSLTVKNANTSKGAVELGTGPAGVTIRSMTFTGNHSTGGAFQAGALLILDGGCPVGGGAGVIEAPLTISGSTFSGNSIGSEGGVTGGAATVWAGDFKCTAIRPVSILNNTFSSNTASGSGAGQLVLGGGLAVLANNEVHNPLTQAGNFFTGNAVTGFNGATNADFGGGGEWVEGMDLTSNGDSFIGNTATGSTTEGDWTWGAGLAILNTEGSCNLESRNARGLATNLVVAGNSISAGLPADAQGAGIYTGCSFGSGSDLTLQDSTVSGNSTVAGGVAGVDGESADHLILANTIDAGNTGGSDLGGFNGSGGSITSSFSDACLAGAAPPGSGNICAPPLLASASDVHETASSPTIDAGSNALVPSGLSTDAFGTPRVLSGRVGCTGGFPAVVDMGAAEFQPGVPSCPPPTPKPPGLTHFVRLKTNAKGAALTLSCSSTDGLGCSGTIFVTSDETLQGKKVVAVTAAGRSVVPVRIAQASFSLTPGSTATIQLKLNSTGLALLHRFHAISAFVVANEASPTSTPSIFLFHTTRFSEPSKHKPKKHKPRRSKHSKHH
jgi:hypothetical protein